MVKLSELEIFLAASEHASFSEAADRLSLSQPAISQNIQQLEAKLDVQLFERDGRRMRLSQAGEALVPMAREVMRNVQHLEQSMRGMRGEILGDLQLGCSSSAGGFLLPYVLAAYKRMYPRVRVVLEFMQHQPMIRRLLDGRLAIALTGRVIEYPGLEHLAFFEDEVILIAAADHPWGRLEGIALQDLLEQPFVLGEPSSATSQIVQQTLAQAEIPLDRLKVVMQLESDAARAMAVEQGVGLAFVSKLAVSRSLAQEHVCEVPLIGHSMGQPLYLVRSRETPFTRAQGRFWAYVQEQEENLTEAIWRQLEAGPEQWKHSDQPGAAPEGS